MFLRISLPIFYIFKTRLLFGQFLQAVCFLTSLYIEFSCKAILTLHLLKICNQCFRDCGRLPSQAFVFKMTRKKKLGLKSHDHLANKVAKAYQISDDCEEAGKPEWSAKQQHQHTQERDTRIEERKI